MEHVHAIDAQPGEAAVEAPPHAVPAEIDDRVVPARGSRDRPAVRIDEHPADLRRDHVVVARDVAEGEAELPFALTRPVQGRGVEEPHVPGERRMHGGHRVGVRHGGEEVADRRATESDVVARGDGGVQRTELWTERHASYSSRLSGVSG